MCIRDSLDGELGLIAQQMAGLLDAQVVDVLDQRRADLLAEDGADLIGVQENFPGKLVHASDGAQIGADEIDGLLHIGRIGSRAARRSQLQDVYKRQHLIIISVVICLIQRHVIFVDQKDRFLTVVLFKERCV